MSGPRKILYVMLMLLSAVGMRMAAQSTETEVFTERVRSLQVRPEGNRYATPGLPVILYESPGALTVDFDVLGDDRDYLRYEIIHCNADWRPSQLSYMEYLDGFNEGTVDNYAFSGATTVHYVHYQLTIPNEQTRLLVSGNYLLKIYDENDGPDKPWLQCRFAVSEQTVPVAVNISGRTDVDYNRSHQQLELALNVDKADVRDIFNDLIIVVEQNGRHDNAVVLDKPTRVSGKALYYEHQPQLIFKAGNEYRRFETISTQFTPMGVDAVEWHSPYYNFYLTPDRSRAGESYHYDETLSGAYVVREYNSDNGDVDADYVITHFSLEYPETPGFDFYIDGDFMQRRFGDESKMRYNAETGRYERAMLLKQGAYSYQYLAVAKGTDTGRTDLIEGDKYETRNRYNVYVYERRPGARYDRLLGFTTVL